MCYYCLYYRGSKIKTYNKLLIFNVVDYNIICIKQCLLIKTRYK